MMVEAKLLKCNIPRDILELQKQEETKNFEEKRYSLVLYLTRP